MKAKKLRGEYVLVEPDLEEETTASGIKIAKSLEQGDMSLGTIRVVGTGKKLEGTGHYEDMDLRVGDRVLFQYGLKMKIEDKWLLLVLESDIKLIVE